VVLPFDERVATTWGHVEARVQKRGRPHPVNDSWIAAVCIVRDHPLMTFNVKDFEDYAAKEGLRLIHGGYPLRP
jgi:toxin FitB